MNREQVKTAIILLAAGNSSRLGQPKQLLNIDQQTLLERSIKSATDSRADAVVVVLGYQANDIVKLIPDAVSIVINDHWEKGMGNSIKVGLKKCMEIGSFNQVIISVCDQPFITPSIFNRLMETGPSFKIATSKYGNQEFGPPVLFRAPMFGQLTTIGDQEGARSLIRKHKDDSTTIDFPEGELDIDTETDYQRYLSTQIDQ